MAAISGITDGEILSSVRTKLNNVITEINLLDPTDWVDYSSTSTVVGWSTTTQKDIRYRVIGKMVFVNYLIVGTSNSTSATFTLPFNSVRQIDTFCYSVDNSTGSLGLVEISQNTNVATGFFGLNAWTALGSKRLRGQLFYEIA